jgi:putative acyl-CoA dehydrogenase
MATVTHTVFNQPDPLEDYNLFAIDVVLNDTLRSNAAAADRVSRFGAFCGSAEAMEWAVQANTHPPELRTHTRYGDRVDVVDFHPAYHRLMEAALRHGVHNLPWVNPDRPGGHVARAALLYLAAQNEAGHCCPVSMTYAVIPALRKQPDLAAIWEPRLLSSQYDPCFLPAEQKSGATMGMGMTEKQGGSDVRANTTRAERREGDLFALTGHKWFCSAPMSDAFLMLAQAPRGLSCFLVPRFTTAGVRNEIRIQRLKQKLGNRSNASSEIELDGAEAHLVGEEGRGVPTIIDMVNHTRLDCTVSSAGLMRQVLTQALHHCRHRSAFGRLLIDQPLMRSVLADLALEWEAAARLAMRVAQSYDDPAQGAFRRIASAIAKYWVCKRTPGMVVEALECLGGNGYVEESPMPRLFRESPLAGIWEGSGNVICLDVLRALHTHPETMDGVLAELDLARGADPRFDSMVDRTRDQYRGKRVEESAARNMVEELAIGLQTSLMIRFAPQAASDAFVASRVARTGGFAFGALAAGTDVAGILSRAWLE